MNQLLSRLAEEKQHLAFTSSIRRHSVFPGGHKMVASKGRRGLLCFVILVVVQLECALALAYFTSKCGQIIDISTDHSVQFDSQSSFSYESNQDCTVTIQTSILKRVLVTFNSVNIEGSSPCSDDYLEIYDGPYLVLNKLATVCGSSTPSAVASTLPAITLRFKTDSLIEYTGFNIIVTSFSPGFCGLDEFECDNGRCIDTSLKYNFYDNCGDSSDENFGTLFVPTFGYNDYNVYLGWSIGLTVGIIVGCIVGVILLSICCGCLCYHLCCKNQTPRTTTVVVPLGNQQQPGAYVQQPGAPPPAYNQPPMAMQQIPGQYGQQQATYNVIT